MLVPLRRRRDVERARAAGRCVGRRASRGHQGCCARMCAPVRIVGSATFLQDRARRRLASGITLAGVGGTLFLVSLVMAELSSDLPLILGTVPSFFGLGALLIGSLRVLSARRDAATIAGEGPVVAQLSARLNDDYVYLRHVTLRSRATAEADGVLVGPHGALVLAIRALGGEFTVRGHDW